jgi:hypothetical protein
MTVSHLVERERSHLRRAHVVAGLALGAAASALTLALGVLALGHSRWMELPRPMPFVVWLVVGAIEGGVVWWTYRLLVIATTRSNVAAEIEREQALRAGALRGVLEIADSGALGKRAAERMSAQLGAKPQALAPAARRVARRRAVQTFASALVALGVLGWVAPAFNDGMAAILQPVHAWRGTLLPKLEFRNLPTHVVRGEDLRLEIAAPGRRAVTLSQRTTGEAWRTTTVTTTTSGGDVARTVVGPLQGDLTLVASDGRSASDTMVVHVTDRPFVGAVQMRAMYPAYLGRSPEGLPIGEPARVPQGTIIEVTGRASTELKSIRLVAAADTAPFVPNGHAFIGRFAARHSAHWMWYAVGAGGPIADLPLPLELEVVPDSAPRAEIVTPHGDTAVAADDRVGIRVAASDDHGLSTVELRTWSQNAQGKEGPVVAQKLAANTSTVWSDLVAIDLSPRDLQPGDALHVKVVATDNSPWGQHGESRELLLKIPTMEERRAIARDAADSAVRSATAAASDQRALQKRTDEASRDRGQRSNSQRGEESNPSGAKGNDQSTMSYEAAEQARNVAKDQRALADRVKNLQEQAKALEQQLKAAGALDSTLAQQLREAQELLRQALTPELLEQMQKLEQSAQQLQGDQARQAMKDLAAMQQRLREQLEKSAEMLKRAAYEGAMQTLKDEAKEIAERERHLADSARDKSTEQQRAQAKNLADRSDRFAEDVKKLQERLQKDNADAGAERTKEASKRGEMSEEKMRELAEALQKAAQKEQRESAQRNGEQNASRDSTSRTAEAQQRDQRNGDRQAGRRDSTSQGGERKAGEQRSGDQQQRSGDQQQRSGDQQRRGDPSQPQKDAQGGEQRQGSPQQKSGGESSQGQRGQQGGEQPQQARDAAEQMDRAAQAMQEARDAQVQSWKKELTAELDRAIQETLQMAREESAMEQKARSGESKPEDLRGQQSALKQGMDQTAQRLQQEGQKSSLLSGRSQRAVNEAQQKMAQALQSLQENRGNQPAQALGDAAESLNRVAASLARDREKANSASSASGFAEMLQQLQELAKKQGSINSQAQGLMPMPGGQMSQEMQATARALARQQRQVAQRLDEMNDAAGGDRAAQLAKEARQLADALDGGRVDANTVARQQQLFRRLLDAGRTLEKDEREDSNKREAKSATNPDLYAPENTNASGRNAQKFREPNWNELRGLTPEERRAILEYFKRINATSP